jgi:hypothetical protein
MKLLSGEDVTALVDLLLESLPARVLSYLSKRGGQRVVQVSEALTRSLPADIDQLALGEHVERMLEWFVGRGDAYFSAGGKLFAFPPYACFQPPDRDKVPGAVFGDSRAEHLIEAALSSFGSKLRHSLVHGEQTVQLGVIPIGLERTFIVLGDQVDLLKQSLEALGVVIVDQERVRAGLPAVEDLRLPDPEAADACPVLLDGQWQVYRPESTRSQYERWEASPQWESGSDMLGRWMPNEARRFWERRFFVRSGMRGVVEVSRDESLLWQYASDTTTGMPLPVRHRLDGNTFTIKLPGTLPPEFAQWIRLLTGRPVEVDYTGSTITGPAHASAPILSELEDRLGLVKPQTS